MTSLIIFHQWDLGKYSMPCRSTLSVFVISATTQNKHTLMLLMEYSCKRMDFSCNLICQNTGEECSRTLTLNRLNRLFFYSFYNNFWHLRQTFFIVFNPSVEDFTKVLLNLSASVLGWLWSYKLFPDVHEVILCFTHIYHIYIYICHIYPASPARR